MLLHAPLASTRRAVAGASCRCQQPALMYNRASCMLPPEPGHFSWPDLHGMGSSLGCATYVSRWIQRQRVRAIKGFWVAQPAPYLGPDTPVAVELRIIDEAGSCAEQRLQCIRIAAHEQRSRLDIHLRT